MQRLLREAVAGTLPDVALFGLNRRRILEARGLTRPLGPLMAGMDADADGHTDALLSLGQFAGAQHALAAPASTLVACLDPDLVAQAGHDADPCPQSLDDLITLGDDIDGIRIDRREWRFQSLPGARGGRPMTPAESDITFERHAGVAAAKLCQVFARHAGMPGYIDDQARKACPAGDPGIMMDSSSLLTRFDEAAGDRVAVTVCALPIAAKPRGVYFPTLGSTLVMLTDDPEKPQARGITRASSPAPGAPVCWWRTPATRRPTRSSCVTRPILARSTTPTPTPAARTGRSPPSPVPGTPVPAPKVWRSPT